MRRQLTVITLKFFLNIEEITLTNEKSSIISGSAGLKYILNNIFSADISGEYSNESSTKQSVKMGITLEDKITSILNHIGPGDSRNVNGDRHQW